MNVTITVHIDTDGPHVAADAVTATHLRRIPETVHRAVTAALSVADASPAMSTGEIVDDIARAALDAWEDIKPAATPTEEPAPVEPAAEPETKPGAIPEISVEYQPSGWYWICFVGGDFCAEGHPESGGWCTEDRARIAGGFHIVEKHNGKGMAA